MDKLIIKTKNWTRNTSRNQFRHVDAMGFVKQQYPKLYTSDALFTQSLRNEITKANDELVGRARRETIARLFAKVGLDVEYV